MTLVEWRKAVKDRDGQVCVFCGTKERVEAHHIKPQCTHPELKFDVDNGISLCRLHHTMAHGKSLMVLRSKFKSYEEMRQEKSIFHRFYETISRDKQKTD